jgi:hypothetical protein
MLEISMANKILLTILAACLPSASALAYESLNDEQLSDTTGQTGVTISTSVDWVSQAIQIHDLNGVSATIKPGYEFNTGDFVLNGWGIKGCTNAGAGGGCTTTTNPTFNIDIDASGGASPVARVAIAWDSGIQKIRLLLDKISIQNGQGGNNVTLVDFEARDGTQGYIDILRPGVTNPLISIELGNEPSGHMLTMSNANFGAIDFGQVFIRDKQDNLANNRNLRFGLQMSNLNFSGATLDITDNELVVATPSLNNLNVTMSNITAGNTAANMGSLGVVGMNLSNLNIKIAGKL